MSRYLGTRVKIDSSNDNRHNCIECGKRLEYREYIEMTDLCKPCKRKRYNRGNVDHRDRLGNNTIDIILADKLGRGERNGERV